MTNNQSAGQGVEDFTLYEGLVLDAMGRDYSYPSSHIAERVSLTAKEVLRIMRALRARGLAEYGPLYDEDEPFIRGSGYWLSREGVAAQKLREAAATARGAS